MNTESMTFYLLACLGALMVLYFVTSLVRGFAWGFYGSFRLHRLMYRAMKARGAKVEWDRLPASFFNMAMEWPDKGQMEISTSGPNWSFKCDRQGVFTEHFHFVHPDLRDPSSV